MKIPTLHRPQRGFTLIELVVVIAIIMVLAAAGFAVGTAAINKARKLSAQNTATAVDQAINAFYSEYGGFPTTSGEKRVSTQGANGRELLNALLGNDTDLNPRGMSFLSVKEGAGTADSGSNGIIYDDAGNALGLYDPWGNPFVVEMDTEFNDYLEFDMPGIAGASTVRLNRRRVAVYTPAVPEGDTANMSTTVKTW